MNKRKQTMKSLIIANCQRTIELLEDNPELNSSWLSNNYKDMSELKNKMHELRRDTKTLEKMIWDDEYKSKLKHKLESK